MPNDNPFDPRPNEWAEEVRTGIVKLGIPDGIDLNAINPGLVTNHTREMLDAEYTRWLPPLAGPNRRPPRRRSWAPRVPTGQPVHNARARRRTAYVRTQRLFRTSRKRCVRDVLSGTWEEERFPIPMATQELYWCGVFQQASLHDDRRPPPKGPVEWSLVKPIIIEDVTRAV